MPRILPDGTRNTFRIQRLKDKLGNRSNASTELESDGTVAWRVGPEGRGVRTIIEMVNCTRLDCVVGSAALMRKALVETSHHAQYRSAFGNRLIDKPLMRNVLADLALECEAATTLECGLPARRTARCRETTPLNSIWEGSGNVNALDVLRALHKEPATANALMAELAQAPRRRSAA